MPGFATVPVMKTVFERPQTLLTALAPIVTSGRAACALPHFMNAATHVPLDEVARAQADDLNYLWPELTQSLNDVRPALTRALGPHDLRRLFIAATQFFNIVQTQRPLIFPTWTANSDPQEAINSIVTALPGVRFAQPGEDDNKVHVYARASFGFMPIPKCEGGRNRILSVPYFTMEPWMLEAFGRHGAVHALEAFQTILEHGNHDYAHHIVPAWVDPYYLTGHIRRSSVPLTLKILQDESFLVDKRRHYVDHNPDNAYEFAAFSMHAAAINAFVQKSHFGKTYQDNIRLYLDGLEKVRARLQYDQEFKGRGLKVDHFISGATTILAFSLLRVFAPEHPIMQALKETLNAKFPVSYKDLKFSTSSYKKQTPFPQEPLGCGDFALWNAQRMAQDTYKRIHGSDSQMRALAGRTVMSALFRRTRLGLNIHGIRLGNVE